MFESISIRHQNLAEGGNPLDLGFLAEAMFFYQTVRVIADPGILKQLIRAFGPELLLEYLEHGYLRVTYLENGLGIHTTNANTPNERHDAIVYSLPSLALQELTPSILVEAVGRRGQGRRLARRLTACVTTASFESELTENAREDFADRSYVQDSVAKILSAYAPEYRQPDPFRFEVNREPDGFVVDTNIDFGAANHSYHHRIPAAHSSLSRAYILSFLTNIRGHLYFASEYASELAAEHVNSEILERKVAGIAASRTRSANYIRAFEDVVFDESRSVREAINRGDRTFGELLELLRQAEKFKGWLRGQDPDQQLVKSYFREVTQSSWVDRLPAKTVRWSVFTGAGLAIDALGGGGVGTLSGLALSAADAFLLDKLLKGWKPSQFVNHNLSEFLSRNEN